MNSFSTQLASELLGGMSLAVFIASVFWVLYGATITILLDIYTRKKTADAPDSVSWRYFWHNNKLRVLINILIALAVIRFSHYFFGITINSGWAFAVGVCFDGMIILFRKIKKMATAKMNITPADHDAPV